MSYEYQMASLISELADKEMIDTESILSKYLKCSTIDLENLGKYMQVAEHFNIFSDQIVKYTEQISEKITFNSLMYTTMKVIFDTIIHLIDLSINEYTQNPKSFKLKITKIKNDFAPIITITQIVFNNYLDTIDLLEYPDYSDKIYVALIRKWE